MVFSHLNSIPKSISFPYNLLQKQIRTLEPQCPEARTQLLRVKFLRTSGVPIRPPKSVPLLKLSDVDFPFTGHSSLAQRLERTWALRYKDLHSSKRQTSFTPQTWRPSNPQCCTTSSSPLKTARSLSYSYTPSPGSKLGTPSDPHRVRSLFPRPSFWAPTPPLANSVVWAPFSGTSSIP